MGGVASDSQESGLSPCVLGLRDKSSGWKRQTEGRGLASGGRDGLRQLCQPLVKEGASSHLPIPDSTEEQGTLGTPFLSHAAHAGPGLVWSREPTSDLVDRPLPWVPS